MAHRSDSNPYHIALACIYSVVLLSGILGVGVLVHILKSNSRSVTTIAVLNLIIAHLLFLLTVPFRLHYYASGHWTLGRQLCNVVSGMIHVHMNMAFLFYVVILAIRLVAFHRGSDTIRFYRKLHAVALSVSVWSVALVSVPCVLYYYGGQTDGGGETDGGSGERPVASNWTVAGSQPVNGSSGGSEMQCFNFGSRLQGGGPTVDLVRALNYTISAVVVLGACVLTGLQVHVLVVLGRKYGRECGSQQEFWAQLKSLCFALILMVCFVPYHLFRIYYVNHSVHLEDENEVFLCITTISCFDVVTFMGRGSCYTCQTFKPFTGATYR